MVSYFRAQCCLRASFRYLISPKKKEDYNFRYLCESIPILVKISCPLILEPSTQTCACKQPSSQLNSRNETFTPRGWESKRLYSVEYDFLLNRKHISFKSMDTKSKKKMKTKFNIITSYRNITELAISEENISDRKIALLWTFYTKCSELRKMTLF